MILPPLPRAILLGCLALLTLLFFAPVFAHAQVETRSSSVTDSKNVVLLYSYGDGIPSYQQITSGFLSAMETGGFSVNNLFFEYLDLERGQSETHQADLINLFRHKYAGKNIDLVVTVHGRALEFLLGAGRELFPGSPVLSILGPDTLDTTGIGRNVLLMPIKMDFQGTLELVITLFPQTTQVVVVNGVGEGEMRVVRAAADIFAQWRDRIDITFTQDLGVEEMLRFVADLPPHSVVLYYNVFRDKDGQTFLPRDVARRVALAANVPVFGMYNTVIENGIVGGSVMQLEEIGKQAGTEALNILGGRTTLTDPVTILPPVRFPMFDWQQLRRWGVEHVQLPQESLFLNRSIPLWKKYQTHLTGIALFVLGQTLLIALLLRQVRHRKITDINLRERLSFERLLTEISLQFINLPATRIHGEIENIQRRVCTMFDFDYSTLWQRSFTDSPYIFSLTHLYRAVEGPEFYEMIDAKKHFPWCLRELEAGRIIAVSVKEVPAEAEVDHQTWNYFQVKSVLSLPLMEEGRLIGALTFGAVQRERSWPDPFVEQMHLLAQIFANALCRDIADKNLRESEARLSLATRAARAGLWILDLETGEFWLSDINRSLFQIAPEAPFTLERFMVMVHRDDREVVRQTIQQATEQDGLASCEYRINFPDGSTRWIGSFGQRDSVSRSKRLMGVSIDLTERLEAEEQVRRQWDQLAHVTRVGTMGELTASLAHEINQPLTAIRSNAEAAQRFLARNEPDIGEVRLILEDIIQDSSRAGNVIRKVRNMLRKESAELITLDLNEVISDALSLIRDDSLAQGMRIFVDLAPEQPLILADRVQVQQVLINLILNGAAAMRAAPEDQRKLVVKTEVHEGASVLVAVTDRGHGFDMGNAEKLFEPFYTTKSDGLGLGLSISQTIITAHGGTITAKNNPEGGATFSFTLPVHQEGAT